MQDTRGRVVKAPLPERRNWLGVDPHAVEIVHEGMADVVNGPRRHRRRAPNSATPPSAAKPAPPNGGRRRKTSASLGSPGFFRRTIRATRSPCFMKAAPARGSPAAASPHRWSRRSSKASEDDIKDTIAPPKKALIVVDESSGKTAPPVAIPVEPDSEVEGFLHRSDDAPLRALPVEPLDTGAAPEPMEETHADEPVEARPIRAIPVREDEVIEDSVAEP